MSTTWNEEFEDRVAKALIDLLPELLGKALPSHPPPGPDRLDELDGVGLGVEITRLHSGANDHGSKEAQQRAATAEFFSLVQKEIRACAAPCRVGLTLFGDITGGQQRARALAGEVLALLLPAVEAGTELRMSRLVRHHGLPPEVVRLELDWLESRRGPWLCLTGPSLCIRSDFAGPLQATLDYKAKKIEEYRKYGALCWIVVVLPYYYEVEESDGTSPALRQEYTSPFDRVLLVNYGLDRVYEVAVERGTEDERRS